MHATGSLNAFLARGPRRLGGRCARGCTEWLTDDAHRAAPGAAPAAARPTSTLHLPFEVADYVDFYSSRHHAENVGRIFRPDAEPLTPNWTHLPIGYHGRAGTVAVVRHAGGPAVGAALLPGDDVPTFGPSHGWTSRPRSASSSGRRRAGRRRCRSARFADHVFGVCLVNDWSARDLQAWEYVPLGPFLGKSFLTSVSPWVVPLAALEAARVPAAGTGPGPLPYLRRRRRAVGPGPHAGGAAQRRAGQPAAVPPACTGPPAQQLAHLTVNGARAADRRPVRVRARSAARDPTSAARCSSCPGTAPSR